jgi:diguanylate cyclase (GGDEF)-like protein
MKLQLRKLDASREDAPRIDEGPAGRVLIVDDIADNRVVLARLFQRRGFEIGEAGDGEEALRLIEKGSFDVVLLDAKMPGLDGVEVLRRVRASRSAAILPVIIMTEKAFFADVAEFLKLGANDCFAKPVAFAIALERVIKEVARRRAELELRRVNSALEDAKKQLEERVSERSAQLVQANAAMSEEAARRMATEDRIAFLAHHDTLTGLANRFHFESTLLAATVRAREERLRYSVLFVDLDGFKNINDTLGHSVGDALLREVAERIRQTLPAGDFAARFGGDEFAVLHVSDDLEASSITLARRLIEIVSACQMADSHQVFIGASVGIALVQDGPVDPVTLMKRADLAMYRAKADGRGQYRLFHPDMDSLAQTRRALDLALRAALARGEFELFFQPIVSIGRRRIAGFETLLRWNHPDRGLVLPDEFINLAEDTGLIVPIGEWIVRQACAEAARWPAELLVAVNLSAIQFRNRNLVAVVIDALARSSLPPARLELEITESALLADNSQTVDMLRQLRHIGVRISLDDFGAGFSGLGYLRSVRFDTIKIDKSFVHDMASKDESLAIVRSAISIGATLGISTTAEGVETERQLHCLAAEGCTEAQGYLFGAAQPATLAPRAIERIQGMRCWPVTTARLQPGDAKVAAFFRR